MQRGSCDFIKRCLSYSESIHSCELRRNGLTPFRYLMFLSISLSLLIGCWHLNYLYLIYLILIICLLLILVLVERKFFAIAQRRVGPTLLGRNGVQQLFADLFKTLNKQIFATTLFLNYGYWVICGYFILHLISLQFITICWYYFIHQDYYYLLFFQLIFSILANCCFLYLNCFINSKYNFIAMTRAVLNSFISDLFITSTYILIIFLVKSPSLIDILIYQEYCWFVIILFPFGLCFIFQLIFESRRTPFDNLEAESELVSGYTTDISGFNLMILLLVEYVHIALSFFINFFLFCGTPSFLSSCGLYWFIIFY